MESTDLLKVIVPVATAFVGYGIREYQNRNKPFITFDGIVESGKRYDIIKIPKNVIDTLDDAVFCKGLLEETRHGSFLQAYERCSLMKRFGLETLNNFDKLFTTSDKTFFIEALSENFNNNLLDRFIMVLLVNDIINFQKYSISDSKIEFTIDDDGIGFFHFPQNGVSFGKSLKNPAIIYHVLPFIKIIQSLDSGIIIDLFNEIKKLF